MTPKVWTLLIIVSCFGTDVSVLVHGGIIDKKYDTAEPEGGVEGVMLNSLCASEAKEMLMFIVTPYLSGQMK